MNPNIQYALAIIVLFGAYYAYWVLHTRYETKKIQHIRDKGEALTGVIADIDSNIQRGGGRYHVYVNIETPEGTRKLRNFPRVKKAPYGVGMEVPIYFCADYDEEFIFGEDWVLRRVRPLMAVEGGVYSRKKFAILSVIFWAVAAVLIVGGLLLFGRP